MRLKSITLHQPATDNAGQFRDAGEELTVGEAAKPGVISAERAKEIVDQHGATGHHEQPKQTSAERGKAGDDA
ncbi:MAG TPA: hypothetical protein VM662_09240 [Sphingomonas sp.]|nr:hypothetical protein [Sphingomonas sp.]